MGTVEFYIAGTTDLKDTWADRAQTILNTNPIRLDAAGRAVIWGDGLYRQVVKDSLGNVIWDRLTEIAQTVEETRFGIVFNFHSTSTSGISGPITADAFVPVACTVVKGVVQSDELGGWEIAVRVTPLTESPNVEVDSAPSAANQIGDLYNPGTQGSRRVARVYENLIDWWFWTSVDIPAESWIRCEYTGASGGRRRTLTLVCDTV
jgi:hypothetical protein